MCFSANVSFISAAILTLISIACFAISKTKGERFVSTIPLFFGIQQFIEGILWLCLPGSSWLISLLTYCYLFFALIWWPIWMPVCIAVYEKDFWRKVAISVCAALGVCCSIFYFKHFFVHGATTFIVNTHIRYELVQAPGLLIGTILTLLYFVCAISPFFISSRKNVWMLGATISAAYLISFIFYYANLASIWCFFGAIISILTLWIIWTNQKPSTHPYSDSDIYN